MPNRRQLLGVVAAVTLAIAVFDRATLAQGPPPLFTAAPAGAPVAAERAPDGLVRRSRAVIASLGRLQAAMTAGQAGDRQPLFALNLFDDVVLPATFERFENDGFGHQTWVGRVVGDPISTVTLTWKGDVLSGGVQTGDTLYRLTTRDGATIIDQLDPGGFPPELPPVIPEGPSAPLSGTAVAGPLASGEVVDIFVYYTSAARAAQGGKPQIEALIAQGIADSNTTYARSGVQGTLRLVGTDEAIGFPEDFFNMAEELNTFRFSPTVNATRETFKADLMHLVVSRSWNACGLAFVGPREDLPYGVTSRECFAQYTFTHEVGHGFGNNHAPEDGAFGGFRPYSYGYKSCGGAPSYHTVMAYACQIGGSARILHLSNPAVAFHGLPTGTTFQNNALSQAEAFPIVARHRAVSPTAPLSLQAVVTGNRLFVSWSPPTTGAPFTSYVLQAGTGSGQSNLFGGPVGPVTAISATVPNGTYYIRVAAQNAAGVGPFTPEIAVAGVRLRQAYHTA